MFFWFKCFKFEQFLVNPLQIKNLTVKNHLKRYPVENSYSFWKFSHSLTKNRNWPLINHSYSFSYIISTHQKT